MKPRDAAFLAVFAPLALLLVLLALHTLRLRMVHDTPVLLYMALLMDRFGHVPYRDFWDINPLGTHVLHVAIGRLIGYTSDLGLRVVDLLFLTTLLGLAGAWLRRLGWKVAIWTTVVFGLIYLRGDFDGWLQRDCLALLPIVGAAALATDARRLGPATRGALIGLLYGLVATLKPHLALGLPVTLYAAWRGPVAARGRTLLGGACAGLAIPLVAVLAYLVGTRALGPYLEIVRGYYPLYAVVTADGQVLETLAQEWAYTFGNYVAISAGSPWVLTAVLGLYKVVSHDLLDRAERVRVGLLIGLTAVYGVYPALAGKFFTYQWAPFTFFLLALGGLCFFDRPPVARRFTHAFPAAVALVVLLSTTDFIPVLVRARWAADYTGRHFLDPSIDNIDRVAGYLREHLAPGDRVQPLDWVAGGVLHALLQVQADVATPYIADMVFYQSVSDPYVQQLRADLIRRLTAAPPRFVVEYQHPQYFHGRDASMEFKELRAWLGAQYAIAWRHGSYVIYERLPV